MANAEACESFSTEVRIQPDATAENNTEKSANSGKYAIFCKREEKLWPPGTWKWRNAYLVANVGKYL